MFADDIFARLLYSPLSNLPSGQRGAGCDERNFGYSAAHEADPLPLLPSGPGGVRGESLHRARSSTDRQSPQRIFLLQNRWAKSSTALRAIKANGQEQGSSKPSK